MIGRNKSVRSLTGLLFFCAVLLSFYNSQIRNAPSALVTDSAPVKSEYEVSNVFHDKSLNTRSWDKVGKGNLAVDLNRSSKKKERATISKTGAWIISDSYEYLLDENLARQLVNLFRNNTVIEFGAGTGRYTSYLRNMGIDVRGYDGVKNIYELTNGLVQSLDLTKPVGIIPSDWVLCLEVAEHIPKRYEDIFLQNIWKSSLKGVVLSWAGISQPGVGHVNNREQNYVKNLMTRGGFTYVEESSKLLRNNAKLWWFKKNVMVFVREK